MKIIQVINALDFGDGVSNDVINKRDLLLEMGYDTEIYSRFAHEKVKHLTKDIEEISVSKNDIILHHFSGESLVLKEVLSCKCCKLLVYHNITPGKFFGFNGPMDKGEEQLKKYYKEYDGFIGDSKYNLQDLINWGIRGKMKVLPILLNFDEIEKYRIEKSSKREINFLFVGRVAPNKKHEDIIDIFNYFFEYISQNIKLNFVGNYVAYMEYYEKLLEKIKSLPCKEKIFFEGKVEDNKLYEYYASADIFVCMSEHEGFCIPLLESMCFDIPTLAYDSSAVSETMGKGGILFYDKNPAMIAKVINAVLQNEEIYKKIICKQRERLFFFSKDNIKKNLQKIIEEWSIK